LMEQEKTRPGGTELYYNPEFRQMLRQVGLKLKGLGLIEGTSCSPSLMPSSNIAPTGVLNALQTLDFQDSRSPRRRTFA
ncbi:MAG TPA: hypothetical protein VIX12_00245, partial [Candidatus Binataceae bacterium]